MNYITYGQTINGTVCRCLPVCMVTCICGCESCKEIKKIAKETGIIYEGWTNSNSSNLQQHRYDEEMRELHVIFHNGQQGVYHLVEKETFEEFEKADSKGQFLQLVIKPNHRWSGLKRN